MAAAGVLSVVALAGCGDGSIDNTQAEQIVRGAINGSPSGNKLKSIHCPTGVTAKAGTSFNCTLTVRLTDGSTHSGTVTLHIVNQGGSLHLKASDSDYHLQ